MAAGEGGFEGRVCISAGDLKICTFGGFVSPIKRSTGGINLAY
jgi:hypothetical protein